MTIKVTAEQELHFLERDVFPLLNQIVLGYDYDPGSSDLDDEQPINIFITLGEYRRARRLQHELAKVCR
jgi:hypothetical protein